MGHRIKQRIPATVQLVVGEDDDLIQWVNSLPSGAKNQALKTVLRMGLELPIPQPAAAPAPIELDSIYQQLDRLQRLAGQGNGGGEVNEEIQEQFRKWAHWFEYDLPGYIQNAIDQTLSGQTPLHVVGGSTQQLSQAELTEREGKLKKAKW